MSLCPSNVPVKPCIMLKFISCVSPGHPTGSVTFRKKFEFITTVQTGLINNAINRSLDDDVIKNRTEFSLATVLFEISEAFRAGDMIPETESARKAAWDFTMWKIHGDDDPAAMMPLWFGPIDE